VATIQAGSREELRECRRALLHKSCLIECGVHRAALICSVIQGCRWSRPSYRAGTDPLRGTGAVQHGSTATHTDRGGRAGTQEDGDLRGWTRVDVLPPDGRQEVRSSNLLSSTGENT
jgi:hypothetical protein